MNMSKIAKLYVIFALCELTGVVRSFDIKAISIAAPRIPGPWVHPQSRVQPQVQPQIMDKPTVAVTTFEEAIQIIDECAFQEAPSDQLYQAVRLVEKNANKFYPSKLDKQALWDRAQGNFKLVLSTGNAKTKAFHPPNYIFAFSYAMIRDGYFGNGFGPNEDNVWVSILQKTYVNMKIRQMVVTVKDIYLGGNKATDKIPQFFKKAINLGMTPQHFEEESKRPPAFCILAATEHALVARGNQSGSLAIWKRFPKDIRTSAYKDLPTGDV